MLDLQRENARLRKENANLKEKIEILGLKILELERRIGLNSKNSSKPPSSDGLSKSNTIPKSQLHKLPKNKSASKTRKTQNALKQVDQPDHIVDHYAKECSKCFNDLEEGQSESHEKRQVFEVPVQRFIVTEHRLHKTLCTSCNYVTTALPPVGVKGHTQYGDKFKAMCVYLNMNQFIPYKRISEIMLELFGRRVSEQIIINAINEFGSICKNHIPVIEKKIKEAEVKYADETGMRIEGSLHWLFVACTNRWTQYWVSKKRGDVIKEATGILSRDCFGPYDTYNKEAKMSLCNAHLLRDLEGVKDVDQHEWVERMKYLLLGMNKVKILCQNSLEECIPEICKEVLIKRYDEMVLEGHNLFKPPPDGKEKNQVMRKLFALIRRLRERKDDILRFFTDPAAPFTNNAAENDIRMNKVRQKISGCFRKLECAEVFADVRSVVMTLKKQEINLLDEITQSFQSRKIHFIY